MWVWTSVIPSPSNGKNLLSRENHCDSSDLSALRVRCLLLSLGLDLPAEVVQSPALVCMVSCVYSVVSAVLLCSSQLSVTCTILLLTLCKLVEKQLVVTCVVPNSHSLIAKETPRSKEQKPGSRDQCDKFVCMCSVCSVEYNCQIIRFQGLWSKLILYPLIKKPLHFSKQYPLFLPWGPCRA